MLSDEGYTVHAFDLLGCHGTASGFFFLHCWFVLSNVFYFYFSVAVVVVVVAGGGGGLGGGGGFGGVIVFFCRDPSSEYSWCSCLFVPGAR